MQETPLTHLIGSNTLYNAGDRADLLTLGRDAVNDALDVGGDLKSQEVLVVTIPVTFLSPSSHQAALGVIFQFSRVGPFIFTRNYQTFYISMD